MFERCLFFQKLPRQTFRRIHGRLGVSGICCSNSSEFYSIGRDGFIRYWRNDSSIIEHMAADKLPVKWPVRAITSPSYGLLVLGFNEVGSEFCFLYELAFQILEKLYFADQL